MSDQKEEKYEPKAGVPPVVKSVPGEKEEDIKKSEKTSDQNDSSSENKSNEEQ